MLISNVITLARDGEISNLSEVKFTDAKVLGYINLGLIELYKRFSLRTEEAIITMSGVETTYTLDGSDVNVARDSAIELFAIVEAYDEAGYSLPINVENDEYSILTPTYNTVQIPNPADGDRISIIYTAAPDWITAITETLPISVSLLEALLHYIGYRAHGSVNGNIDAENNTHYKRFEASVARAKALGVVTEDDIHDRPTSQGGYV